MTQQRNRQMQQLSYDRAYPHPCDGKHCVRHHICDHMFSSMQVQIHLWVYFIIGRQPCVVHHRQIGAAALQNENY